MVKTKKKPTKSNRRSTRSASKSGASSETKGRTRTSRDQDSSEEDQEDKEQEVAQLEPGLLGEILTSPATPCNIKNTWKAIVTRCAESISMYTKYDLANVVNICNDRKSNTQQIKDCVALIGETVPDFLKPSLFETDFRVATSKQAAIVVRALTAKVVFQQGRNLEKLPQSEMRSVFCCLRAAGHIAECPTEDIIPMVSAGSRVLLGLEGEFPLHLFILEDALLIAKKRVQQHEGFERFFQRRFPDGSVSSAATAVELWMQASFDVAKGKVNMEEEQPGPNRFMEPVLFLDKKKKEQSRAPRRLPRIGTARKKSTLGNPPHTP